MSLSILLAASEKSGAILAWRNPIVRCPQLGTAAGETEAARRADELSQEWPG